MNMQMSHTWLRLWQFSVCFNIIYANDILPSLHPSFYLSLHPPSISLSLLFSLCLSIFSPLYFSVFLSNSNSNGFIGMTAYNTVLKHIYTKYTIWNEHK